MRRSRGHVSGSEWSSQEVQDVIGRGEPPANSVEQTHTALYPGGIQAEEAIIPEENTYDNEIPRLLDLGGVFS